MTRLFACLADDVPKGSARTIRGEHAYALFRTDDGTFHATDDTCTHEKWSLGEDSDLDGVEVTCPLHMARFDVTTGKALCFPATVDLATYPVEVDADGKVFIVSDL